MSSPAWFMPSPLSLLSPTRGGRPSARQKWPISILAGVITAITSMAERNISNLKITTNYMMFLELSAAAAEQRNSALFRFGDEHRYTGFLILHQGRPGSPQGRPAILPVDGRITDREIILPGAPEAFVLRKAAIINCDEVTFRKGVDKKIRADIQKFFSDVEYASVASIPISTKDGPRGVYRISNSTGRICLAKGRSLEGRFVILYSPLLRYYLVCSEEKQMAIFGKDLDVFQQIAGGNLNVLRDLISSSADLMKQQQDAVRAVVPAPQVEQGLPAAQGGLSNARE